MQDLSQIQLVRINISKISYKIRIMSRNNIVIKKIVALLRKDIVKSL
jgi:hypothetical protein